MQLIVISMCDVDEESDIFKMHSHMKNMHHPWNPDSGNNSIQPSLALEIFGGILCNIFCVNNIKQTVLLP